MSVIALLVFLLIGFAIALAGSVALILYIAHRLMRGTYRE
jgi:hypothetical protein